MPRFRSTALLAAALAALALPACYRDNGRFGLVGNTDTGVSAERRNYVVGTVQKVEPQALVVKDLDGVQHEVPVSHETMVFSQGVAQESLLAIPEGATVRATWSARDLAQPAREVSQIPANEPTTVPPTSAPPTTQPAAKSIEQNAGTMHEGAAPPQRRVR